MTAVEELRLKPLSDSEYDRARVLVTLAGKSMDICPTCGGREESIPQSGMKHWVSNGYWLDSEHHDCNCQVQIGLCARYLLANIGDQYQRLNWDDFTGSREADEQVRQYIENWPSFLAHGFGLTFASKWQGVGKTFAATHVGKELVKRRQRVYFLDFVQMVDAFCGRESSETEARMRNTTFVILDDVRTGISERQTDLYALKFEVVLRHRTNFNLPTFFTTNLSEADFEHAFPRIYSLIAPKQRWIDMSGMDHRKRTETAARTKEQINRGERIPIS